MECGIVVAPHFTYDGRSLHFPGLVGIEPEQLRNYLLYWDKIDFPNNNMIHIGDSPDFGYLGKCPNITKGDVVRCLVRIVEI